MMAISTDVDDLDEAIISAYTAGTSRGSSDAIEEMLKQLLSLVVLPLISH